MGSPSRAVRREPRYRAIAKDIWRRMAEDAVPPGEPLPSELDLAAEYEVSRLTIRQALDELRRSGAIEVRHGAGAFVAIPPTLVEFTTRVHAPRGRDVYWVQGPETMEVSDNPGVVERILQAPAGRPDPRPGASRHLDVEAHHLRFVDTLMLKDSRPWIVNTYVFSQEMGQALARLTGEGRLGGALQQSLGEPLLHHWRAFSAATCSLADAEALDLLPGSAVLVRDGVMGTRERALVYVNRRMSGESAKFVLRYVDPNEEGE